MPRPLLRQIESKRDLVIRLQKELTARPALGPENGGTGEEKKARWLVEELARMGFKDIRQFPCPDDRVSSGYRPNIAALLPGKSARTLWIIGHLDVVPPGEPGLWRTSPYEVAVDGDFVFGRGVEDNQQAIVSALLAADTLLASGTVPDLTLGLLFVADEETGMKHGLPFVLDHSDCPVRRDDLVLVPDMGNASGTMVEVVEKSCLWLRFTITGKQCHASRPDDGINSLVAASDCVLSLEELYRTFRKKDPLFSPSWSTFVPSKKEANVENINTMPGEDIFYLDCRVLPEYDLDDVEAECRRIAGEAVARHGASIEIEVVHREASPGATPVDAPVVQRLLKALDETRGIAGVFSGSGGQTVASCLRQRGIDAAVWATLVPNPHTPNERSSITATIDDAKVMLAMLFG